MAHGLLVTSLGALVLLKSGTASADVASAEVLFREARALLDAGKVDAACERFEASSALEPSSGTLLNLAACRLRQGRTATAWAYFLSAARTARSQNRPLHEKEAHRRAVELEPELSYLTIDVAEPVPGLHVVRNGRTVESRSFGSRLPVDPGMIVVEASAPGFVSERLEVTVGEGQDARAVTIPKLRLKVATRSRRALPRESVAEPRARMEDDVSPWPWLVGGLGAAALLTGGAFGLLALSSDAEAQRLCGQRTTGCGDDALAVAERRDTQALASTVGVSAGLAGLGVAAVLFLTATGEQPQTAAWLPAPSVNARGAQLSLTSRF